MSFQDFELKVRKAFGSLINPGQENVWMDNLHKTGMRYCAKARNGWFITGNALSKTISVYKDRDDRTPTIIPV